MTVTPPAVLISAAQITFPEESVVSLPLLVKALQLFCGSDNPPKIFSPPLIVEVAVPRILKFPLIPRVVPGVEVPMPTSPVFKTTNAVEVGAPI